MHVVCQWIGNSQPIAAKHYLPVTDDHFSKALQQPAILPRTKPQAVFPQMKQPRKFAGAAAAGLQLGNL